MVKKLRAIPRHAINNIEKKKLDAQPRNDFFFHETHNTETQNKKIATTCACAAKNIFWIRIKKTSSIGDRGKNVTIAKDIMNYI